MFFAKVSFIPILVSLAAAATTPPQCAATTAAVCRTASPGGAACTSSIQRYTSLSFAATCVQLVTLPASSFTTTVNVPSFSTSTVTSTTTTTGISTSTPISSYTYVNTYTNTITVTSTNIASTTIIITPTTSFTSSIPSATSASSTTFTSTKPTTTTKKSSKKGNMRRDARIAERRGLRGTVTSATIINTSAFSAQCSCFLTYTTVSTVTPPVSTVTATVTTLSVIIKTASTTLSLSTTVVGSTVSTITISMSTTVNATATVVTSTTRTYTSMLGVPMSTSSPSTTASTSSTQAPSTSPLPSSTSVISQTTTSLSSTGLSSSSSVAQSTATSAFFSSFVSTVSSASSASFSSTTTSSVLSSSSSTAQPSGDICASGTTQYSSNSGPVFDILCNQVMNGYERDLASVGSFTDCINLCGARSDCMAVSYAHDTKACMLKAIVGPTSQSSQTSIPYVDTAILRNPTCGLIVSPYQSINGVHSTNATYDMYCGNDMGGNDISPGIPGYNSLAACATLCATTQDCVAASFVKDAQLCWLKNKIGHLTSRADGNVDTAVVHAPAFACSAVATPFISSGNNVSYDVQCNIDMGGSDIANVGGHTSVVTCANYCSTVNGCVAASFVHDTGMCWVKFGYGPMTSNGNVDTVVMQQ